VALALSVLVAGQALAITWGSRTKLADGSLAAGYFNHSVEVVGSNAYVVYNTDPGVLKFRRSTDLGGTWAAAVTLQNVTATTYFTALGIAGDGSTLIAVFEGYDFTAGVSSIYVKRSTDGGATWKTRQLIASATGAFSTRLATVDVSGSLAVVGWTDPVSGVVYVKRSTDGGATWKTRQNLGTTTYDPYAGGSPEGLVTVGVTGTYVYVAWVPAATGSGETTGTSVVARRSADSGATYVARQTVDSRDVDPFNAPAMAALGSTVLIEYQLADGRVVVERSTDFGTTYASSTVASPSSSYGYVAGDVFLGDGGLARVVFVRFSAADDRVMIKTSDNGGQTWGTATTSIGADPTSKLEAAVVANATYTLVLAETFPDVDPFLPQIHKRRGTN